MKLLKATILLGILGLASVAAFMLRRRSLPEQVEILPEPILVRQDRKAVQEQSETLVKPCSEPGGTVVILAAFGIFAATALFILAFVFPPGFVAAALAFGPVSVLGFVVLVVHYRNSMEKG